jgi:hypothetical protein
MKRIAILDGLRGYFLVFMLINHLRLIGGVWLARLNLGELGYVQDVQGFVFLSGLLVGLLYTRRMLERGFTQAARKMWRRALQIYCYALACLFGIAALSGLIPGAAAVWSNWLWGFGYLDPGYLASAALLLYQPNYLDILQQYILYMLAAPFLVWLCLRGRAVAVIAGSLTLWLTVQLGLYGPVADAAHGLAGRIWSPNIVRFYFDPLAWQICFVSGLALGSLTAANRLDWRRVMAPERPVWALAALAVVLVFAYLRLGMTFQFHPTELAAWIKGMDQKEAFGPFYLVNFTAVAYLVGWTLMAGPSARSAPVRGIATFLNRFLRLPFLRLLGRHSLQVYCLHVFLVYCVRLVDAQTDLWSQALKTVVLVTAIAFLGLLALYRETRLIQARQGRAPA